MEIDALIGIDPGESNGAIAYYKPGQKVKVYRMPTKPEDMNTLIKGIKEVTRNPLCLIEMQALRIADVGGKQFGIAKLLRNFERLQATLAINEMNFITVYPKSWQSNLHLPPEPDKDIRKRTYRDVAQKKFPELRVTLWNCDALLLVDFGRFKAKFDPDWIKKRLKDKSVTLF